MGMGRVMILVRILMEFSARMGRCFRLPVKCKRTKGLLFANGADKKRMAKRRMTGSCATKIILGAGEDVISDLPKNLIDMILDALPLRDAVRTSVLSRKWQYRWFTTSELVFSDQFFISLKSKYKKTLRVKNIINKILRLHSGNIRKFTLEIPSDVLLEDDLNQWILFLSTKGTKELTLHCSSKAYHHLGLQLYSFLELTNLNIRKCQINPPASFNGFPNLTILELFWVLVNEKFGDVISACPQLERVSIQGCYGLHNLVLRAPKLQYLCVEVIGLKTICLNSTENLASLSISLHDVEAPEKLCLGDNILEFSAATIVPKRLSTNLVNLKRIVLSYVDFNNVTQIACIHCLIRSSPKLSELDIWGQNTEFPTQDVNFVEDYGDCSFGQLESVRLWKLWGLKAEMALIKLLLGHSPLLELMLIMVADRVGKDNSHSMCKKLTRFARASPKAELVYFDHF